MAPEKFWKTDNSSSATNPATQQSDDKAKKPKITLFLDIVSPFAYIAFYVVKNSPVFKQCDVTYVPIFLGGVMKATGNRPPLMIKHKDVWINKERKRWQAYFNVPMMEDTPKPFPQPTLQTQRALCAIQLNHPAEKLAASFEALYKMFWCQGKPINQPENISTALMEVFSDDEIQNIIKWSQGKEAKQRLTENSDKAMEWEAFGLPWFVATNLKGETETFWGVDHMGQLAEFLGLDRKDEPGLRAML